MRRKRGTITKSLYLWIRSFILVSVVMLGLLVALTTWMVREFSGEIEEMNHGLTSVLQTSMDTRLNDIDHFMAQLQMNAENLKLSRIQDIGDMDQDSLIRFSRQLYDYKLSNTFIKEIYIYYPHLDYVAGDLGYFGAEKYYLLRNDLSQEGYEAWIGMIKAQTGAGYRFLERRDGELDLYLSKQLPYDLSDDKTAILMVLINQEEVASILKNANEGMGNSVTAVTSGDNRVYASVGGAISREAVRKSLLENSGSDQFKLQGNYGSVMDSDYYGIRYVTLVDRRKLLNTGFFIRNIAYASIALCMVFGVLLFGLLGRRNAKPLKDILDKLVNRNEEGGRLLDDYNLIDDRINQMLKMNVESSRKLEQQQETIEGLFLLNLLSSEERNNSVIFASMQKFGIQMEYSLFLVGLIRNAMGFTAEEIQDMTIQIREMMREKTDLSVITSEFGGDLILLFHMEPEYDREKMQAIAAEIITGIHALPSCKIMLGGIYDSMSSIITSFHQAQLMAEFCENDHGSVFFYDEEMVGRQQEGAYGSAMPEYEIAMLEERYEEADHLLDLLFNQYIGSDRNVYTSRAKKYAVIHAVLMALERHEERGGEYRTEEFIKKLSEVKDIQKLIKLLHEGFGYLIRWQQKRQSDQKENLAERAKQYIDLNFEDPMIGLYSISDMLGVSNTYLSTTFKKQYGIGIAQYINTMRIEKAKRLILSTDENIKEIALSVGFSSDAAFIRVFKQFENTTPGRYKKK